MAAKYLQPSREARDRAPEPCGVVAGVELELPSLPTADKQALVYIKSKCMFVQVDADSALGM